IAGPIMPGILLLGSNEDIGVRDPDDSIEDVVARILGVGKEIRDMPRICRTLGFPWGADVKPV
ncbi:hypothetical protein AVEN_257885-1, partial [Araneus ventricosus]